MAVCSFVVSLECANCFYIYWIDRLYGYGNFHYCVRANWRLGGWIFLVSYIFYVFRWYSLFAIVLPFCPANGFGVASQEKVKRVKKCSETQSLATLGAVLLFGLVDQRYTAAAVFSPNNWALS